jgi:hypothetical protein
MGLISGFSMQSNPVCHALIALHSCDGIVIRRQLLGQIGKLTTQGFDRITDTIGTVFLSRWQRRN